MMKEDDRPVRERIRSRLKRESMEDSGTSFQFDDTGIDDIYTDSRKKMANGLFVPIVGEHSDGHDYIEMAIKNGAVAVLSSRPVDKLKDQYPYVRFYQVKNTVDALQEIGRMERAKFTGTVIGVTGSVGKTTTRNMIAAAISAGKRSSRPPAMRTPRSAYRSPCSIWLAPGRMQPSSSLACQSPAK